MRDETFFEPAIPAPQVATEPADVVKLRKELSKKCKGPETVEILTITPEMARVMLERNREAQRHQSPRVINAYSRELTDGRWNLTNQGIGFDTSGYLVDGQHRLRSCVSTQIPFKSVVVYGLDPEAFKYVDSGWKRTAAHKLAISGFANTTVMASAAKVVLIHDLLQVHLSTSPSANMAIVPVGEKSMGNIVPDEFIIDFCEENPDFVNLQHRVNTPYRRFKPVPASLFWAAEWIIREKHPSLAEAFIDQLALGEGLAQNDNVWRWRDELLSAYMSRHRVPKSWILCWLIDVFNDTRRNKRTRFVMTAGRDFPQVLS